MIGRVVLSSIIGVSYSVTVFGNSLDEQITNMYELQVEQGLVNQNVKSRAEQNKLPEFKQKLLDSEKLLNREERTQDRKEYYENELMHLDLESRRLNAKVAKSIVDETDFTYDREKRKIDIELRQLEVESRSIDVERKRERVAQEKNFIALELQGEAAKIKSEEAKAEATRNISTGVRTSLEGIGEAAKHGDLFD